MCGIAGIFSYNKIKDINKRISTMCESMNTRGPNSIGTISLSQKLALGHCRLSIIDLQNNSNQPMCSNDGRYYIVYNGEIVNYKTLKEKIVYDYKTNCDTEVILAAIQVNGLDWFLKKAEGMFAFILYDSIEKCIYLVRDRFGIKPIFYSLTDDNNLIIASEIKGILNSGLVDAKLYENALDEYLAYRYVREPYSFFKGIYQVPHSTYIKFDINMTKSINKYYELPNMNFSENFDEEEIIKKTTKVLENTIRKWSNADVEVGSYLSGGIDSSLLTAIISKNIKNINTYTIGFDDEKTNEFKYAKIISDKYKTKHNTYTMDMKMYFDIWDELIINKDAPLGVPNEIPLAYMTEKLSKDVTVVLSGEGADELFGGYGRIFRSAFDYENEMKNKEFFYDYFIEKYEYVKRDFRNKYLKNIKNIKQHRESYDMKIKNEFIKRRNEENIFRFFHTYHIQGLLQRLDSCTMKSSIESRPPFLDHKLIDFVYKEVPYNLKLKWKNEEDKNYAKKLKASEYSEVLDIPKYILKKISEKYLPYDVIYRKKMGFPIPLDKNFDLLEQYGRELLINSNTLKINSYNEFINDIKELNISSQVIWMLINIEKFKKYYFDKNWRY